MCAWVVGTVHTHIIASQAKMAAFAEQANKSYRVTARMRVFGSKTQGPYFGRGCPSTQLEADEISRCRKLKSCQVNRPGLMISNKPSGASVKIEESAYLRLIYCIFRLG